MKRISMVAVAIAAAALILAGCNGLGGIGSGDTSGSKKNTLMTVSGMDEKNGLQTGLEDIEGAKLTDTTKKDAFNRFWEQLGTLEQVSEVTTKVTIYLDKANKDGYSTLENTADGSPSKLAVTGFVFDLDSTNGNDKTVDFNLLGIRKKRTGTDAYEFYLERYVDVPVKNLTFLEDGLNAPNAKKTGISSKGALGAYYSLKDNWKTKHSAGENYSDWYNLEADMFTKDAGGNIVITITLTQPTAGTYTVKLGTKEVGTFSPSSISGYTGRKEANVTKEGYLMGGIGCYASCPYGTKIVARYESDVSRGKFAAEVAE
ncbi:MAG: hypothetical protein J6I73_03910 [Treponema sp.]|nr:hypothetical protein [Treponema sp.]